MDFAENSIARKSESPFVQLDQIEDERNHDSEESIGRSADPSSPENGLQDDHLVAAEPRRRTA